MLPGAAIILLPCLFYPVARNLAVGQSSLLLLLLMAVTLSGLLSRSRRGEMAAGACLAAGISARCVRLAHIAQSNRIHQR